MLISGHKMESVFEGYNITNARDLYEAAAKMGAFRKRTEEVRTQKKQKAIPLSYLLSNLAHGHKIGTIAEDSR
jgi:hypothetical protein